MKPEAPVEEQGEFEMIQTSIPGLTACEHLPKLASMIDRFTLIRGITHSAGAHPLANQYLFSGNRPSPAAVYPAFGSVIMKERPVFPDLPGFVAIPNSDMTPGYMGVAYAPLNTTEVPRKGQPFQMRGLSLADGVSIDQVNQRARLLEDLDITFRELESNSEVLEAMDGFSRKAQQMILSPRAREAFDTSNESQAVADMFDRDEFSQSLLLAARLAEHGVRFVTVMHRGWDTHLDNFRRLKGELLPAFDAGITALLRALEAKGILDSTLVVATGEFGRTPTINKNTGRDHWPRSMWTLITGGGVKPGQLIGGTDTKGHGPNDSTDFAPEDLGASIYHALGVNHHKSYHTLGRPLELVADGEVIEGLFA